jgi:hypothetical protein
VRRLPQIPYPAFRYLTLNPRGLGWPATRKIGLGRARVKIIDGDSIECTVTVIPATQRSLVQRKKCTVTVIRFAFHGSASVTVPADKRWQHGETSPDRAAQLSYMQ